MSGNKLRLFVAVDIPREARELISSTIEEIRQDLTGAGARWVKPENLHLTLKFIGDYEEEKLEVLAGEILATAERCKSFTASLGGCGAFPTERKTRIIWVGMPEGAEEASRVAQKLDARLEKRGVKREDRPFRGHLTLARLKRPGDCSLLIEDMGRRIESLREMPFEVEDIVLYRSILDHNGPIYTALKRAKLGGERNQVR